MKKLTEKEIGREYQYRGNILTLRVDHVILENGSEATREVIEHPGAVAIMPVTDRGEVYLVDQFRKPIEEVLTEVPAGKLDRGEEPLDCARRELLEETGIVAGRIDALGSIYSTPGFCDEELFLFLALDLTIEEATPDEDEFLNVKKIPWEVLYEKCVKGEMKDAKTNVLVLRAISKVENYLTDK